MVGLLKATPVVMFMWTRMLSHLKLHPSWLRTLTLLRSDVAFMDPFQKVLTNVNCLIFLCTALESNPFGVTFAKML